MKACFYCQESFEPARATRRYCSDRCKHADARRKASESRKIARNEWFSPANVVEAARITMGRIDLDPASCEAANDIIGANAYYILTDDGLAPHSPWFGRIWLNPPYSGLTPHFVRRLAKEYQAGNVEQAIVLLGTHHMTTVWFGALYALNPILCLPVDRLNFTSGIMGAAPQRVAHGSVLLGVGVDHIKFVSSFAGIGHIWCQNSSIPLRPHLRLVK